MTGKACVLFRVDSSPRIGLGHLQRSLALALALATQGVSSAFVAQEDQGSQTRVQQCGFQYAPLATTNSWNVEDAIETIAISAQKGCASVVVDSHEVGPEYLAQVRDAGLFVAARDDLARYPFPCQLVFNGNADAERLPYRSVSGDTRFLLGPEYMVLRPELWAPPRREPCPKVRNILVTLGGTDGYNLMPRIVRLLDEIPGDFRATVVIGPYFQNVNEIKSAAERVKRPVRLLYSPAFISDYVREADLAISAGGQTLYELAAVGCPTVTLRVASNQDGQVRALGEAGFLQSAGHAEEANMLSCLRDAVAALLSDAAQRSAMSLAGQQVVNGAGAMRVIQKILKNTGSGS